MCSAALLKPPPFMAKPRVGFGLPFHPLPLYFPPCNLTSTLFYPPTPFFFLVPTMPVVRTTRNYDDTFHHLQDVGEKYATSHTPVEASVRHARPSNQPMALRRDYILNNTQGHPDGEFNLRLIRDVSIN